LTGERVVWRRNCRLSGLMRDEVMSLACLCLLMIAVDVHGLFGQRDYGFDGKISCEVLENYLSRLIQVATVAA